MTNEAEGTTAKLPGRCSRHISQPRGSEGGNTLGDL